MQVAKFTFNMFMENTYVLYDETKECIIVDPGCQEDYEKKALKVAVVARDAQPSFLARILGFLMERGGSSKAA